MSKVNVLHVITGLGIGGAERIVYSLTRSLDPEKYRVIVCCLKEEGPTGDQIRKSGVEVINLKNKNPWDMRTVLALSKIIKKERINLVHTHVARADVIGGFAARLRGIPAISTVHHTYEPWERHPFYGGIYRKTLNSFDRVIAVSEAVREYLIRWGRIPQWKITVIYNGIDISEYERVDLRYRDSSAAPQNDKRECHSDTECNEGEESNLTRARVNNGKVVGTVARLDPMKGHKYLLRAAKEVIKVLPETKFLIVGDGVERKVLEDMAVDMGIKEHIIFTGWRKDIPNVLSGIDIFVLPSLKEGLGLAILEAMAAKKAVIAADVGGIREVVEDGVTGVLVSTPDDIEGLASAIIRLLSNPEESRAMGLKGYERVRNNFGIDRMREGITGLYESILGKG